jgi:hypothetical protein
MKVTGFCHVPDTSHGPQAIDLPSTSHEAYGSDNLFCVPSAVTYKQDGR